jgi:serine protease Do
MPIPPTWSAIDQGMNHTSSIIRWRVLSWAVVVLLTVAATSRAADNRASLAAVDRQSQVKIVKIYGAGGPRGLEAYQSGFLITSDGYVLTAWSYVLDTDDVAVVLDDGRRFSGKLIGADPLTEVAVLKIDAGADPLPHFDLAQSPEADVGACVLALSNLFSIAAGNEPSSILHGVVSAVAPLEARHGAFSANYRGDVYIVDAVINNPGSAGGALTDQQGRLLGMLGKELRGESTGTWLNYALPVAAFRNAAEAMIAGRFAPKELTEAERPDKPLTLGALGIVLVPDVVPRTPPYVDRIVPDSPAAKAGLRPDDLVVTFDTQVVTSCQHVTKLLERYEQDAVIHVAVLRDGSMLEFTLQAAKTAERAKE